MKKKKYFLVFAILIFITSSLILNNTYAANYYVSSTGNDTADGLTPNTSWLTLGKVNKTRFSPGDLILFKRGDTWRGKLTNSYDGNAETGYIIYSAFGSGDKPKILGSMELSETGSWTIFTGNIWKITTTTPAHDCGNLIFNNETICGIKKQSLTKCTEQGHFFFNASDHKIYLYSSINPAIYYNHIEAGGVYSENIIEFENAKFLIFNNLDVRYSGNNGIFLNSADHIIVENCDFSWIGGWYYNGGPARMGNAVQMWKDNSNIIIRYNRINQIYDAGISPQGWDTYSQTDILMCYNVITNCYYSFEVFTYPGSKLTNVNFYNNSCAFAGSQWSQTQRPDISHPEHVRNGAGGGNVTNCNIKNNIFHVALNCGYEFQESVSGWNIDYNILNVNEVAEYLSVGRATLADWTSATSQDTHSISGNPLNISPDDFHLSPASPAISAGLPVGLTRDFDNITITGNPDIGAFEYTDSNRNKPPSIQNQRFSISENSSNGTIVGILTAYDPDEDQTLKYSILSGNNSGTFAINDSTGMLSIANSASLNMDFTLVVKVQDNGVNELSSHATITINIIPTGVKLTESISTIKVYPNPVSDKLIIEIKGNNANPGFEILNSIGQIVLKGNLSENTTIQTLSFITGVYTLKIEDGKFFVLRKIVQL